MSSSVSSLQFLTRDKTWLFITRFFRLFAYGSLSVVLVFYLTGLGLTQAQTGLLLTLILAGDVGVSLYLTTRADRLGRRRMLIIGSALMVGAGLTFACTHNLILLFLAGTIGVISPSGNEVGPFLSIEQAALSQVVSDRARTTTFAWYTLAGSFAIALGALFAGMLTSVLRRVSVSPLGSERTIVFLYAGIGGLLAFFFSRLSEACEIRRHKASFVGPTRVASSWGLHQSHGFVFKLSGLFALDAFAGGFVMQSFAAYWFYLRFGVSPASLGGIFFGANVMAGISALLASRLASRFGLVRTMVFTHLPSNVLLILVPLMPTLRWAIFILLLRFSISQMDVPTRQSYLMAVVRPEERSATAGITGVARTVGAAMAPVLVGLLFARRSLIDVPFFVAGTLKILYDLLLYNEFVSVRPPEEAT
jgi:MFS family permease